MSFLSSPPASLQEQEPARKNRQMSPAASSSRPSGNIWRASDGEYFIDINRSILILQIAVMPVYMADTYNSSTIFTQRGHVVKVVLHLLPLAVFLTKCLLHAHFLVLATLAHY